jgi:hypothetical protein
VALMLITTASAAHAQETWQVGTAPSFSSGRYGTDTRTEIVHTPITARRLFDDGDLTLVFPFLCISGNGGVTVIDGSPIRTDQSGTSGTRTRPATAARPGTGTPAQPETNCGIGDVIVRGRYYLLDERGWLPTVALRAHLKAPTASAERGLGTGRPDEGVGLEVSRRLGGGVLAMVDGGYTLIGRPEGVDFDNSWWYDVGLGQDLAKGAVNVSVFLEEYSAVVPGLVSARDVLAALTLRGAHGWRVQVAGQFGLSDGAPDHGVTIGASRRF